ncbi:MAG: ABC transporter ATP-binding protein [Thermomicrobiales bacterium]
MTRTYGDIEILKRILTEARPYWVHIGGYFLLSLLATPLALLTPVPLKIAVDALSTGPNTALPSFLESFAPSNVTESTNAAIGFAAAMFLVVALVTQLHSLTVTLLRTYTAEQLVLRFRTKLFRHMQRLSLLSHISRGSSDTTYRIQYDAPAIQYLAIDGVIPFVTAGITLVSMIYVIVRIDEQLAVVALAIAPFLILSTRYSRRSMRKRSREVKKLESSALGVVQEVLGSIRVVKAFAQEDREEARFLSKSSEGMRERLKLTAMEGGLGLFNGLIVAVGTAAVLYVGGTNVQSGKLTLGELLLVMGYLSQLYEPLKTMSRKTASIQGHLESAQRVFMVLDEKPDVVEQPDALAIERATGDIVFENVSFGYDPEHLVLQDVSMTVPAGTRVGISGATGAGKTTLVSLLNRFFDPTEGRILLDGVDLREYKVSDLRNQFSIVLQEPVLFTATIAENIAYARPGAQMEEIVAAATAANAHEFVERLPERYDTQVGERGMRLSGGERQRISLARAFLKDAPILILDEPTSSVDIKTESLIVEAMEELMKERTTFMIAHRLSTLEGCNSHIHIGPVRESWTSDGKLVIA